MKEILEKIKKLKEREESVDDFFEKLEIKDEILELKRKHNLIEESRDQEGCENCSA